jgi:predicted alpha/beta hydrolase
MSPATPSIAIHEEALSFPAKDGYTLHGFRFSPKEIPLRGTIVIHPATAITQRFYKAFAMYLAERGYGVLTYDLRGIGLSRPPKLAGFPASKLDWAKLDMSAAFDQLALLWPDLPRCAFGHSLGGQFFALLDRPEDLTAIVTYGSGFGYWGNIDGAYRYFVAALWYLVVPMGTRIFRYMPAKRLGMAEDLPAAAARDWARWGRRPEYFTSEIGHLPGFTALRAPWKAFLAADDDVATRKNAEALYALYPHAQIDIEILHPARFGCKELGHLRFFSRTNRPAWHVVADFFDRFTTPPPSENAA